MIKKIIKFVSKEISGVHEAAYLLGAFALVSQLLGFIRDRLLASQFGAGLILDTYYASFRIADLLFVIISTLVSLSVLVPFIVRLEDKTDKEKEIFSNTVFTIVSLVSIFFVGTALILSKPLLVLMFPNIMASSLADSLLIMTRVMLIQPIILAFSGFFSSYIQVYKKFFIYALSPVLYNVGIILGVIFFYPIMGMVGLVVGVIFGAVLHLSIQLPTILKHGLFPKFTFYPDLSIIREILTLSVPRTFALVGNQVSQLMLVVLAGTMVSGSISIFSLAFNLQSVPLAIIGVSYSLAAFPTLSRLFNSGDIEGFTKYISNAVKHIIFWSIPVTVLFIVLRISIVEVVLGVGAFNTEDVFLVASSLGIFSVSVVAQSLSLIFIRGYYSTGDTKRPLIFVLISVFVTITSSIIFIKSFNSSSVAPVLMLPIAFSLGQVFNAVLLAVFFNMKYKIFSKLMLKTIFHTTVASVILGFIVTYCLKYSNYLFDINTSFEIFIQGVLCAFVGVLCALVLLILIKNEEVKVVLNVLRRRTFIKS